MKESAGPEKKVKTSEFGQAINDLLKTDPQLAAEQVLAKFLSPRRMLSTPQQRKFLDTADITSIDVDGIAIKTYTWSNTPKSLTVLLSHGFLMNAASMLNFVQPLLQAGFKVVTWDQCAHGESGGTSANTHTWIQTIQTIAKMNTPLAGIIGFSIGGTAALMTLAETTSKLPYPALCCINPPTSCVSVLSKFLASNGCDMRVSELIPRVVKAEGIISQQQLGHILVGSNKICETKILIFRDRDDTVASVAEAQWLVVNLPHAELRLTRHLGHNGALSDRDVVKAAARFMGGDGLDTVPIRSRL